MFELIISVNLWFLVLYFELINYPQNICYAKMEVTTATLRNN